MEQQNKQKIEIIIQIYSEVSQHELHRVLQYTEHKKMIFSHFYLFLGYFFLFFGDYYFFFF